MSTNQLFFAVAGTYLAGPGFVTYFIDAKVETLRAETQTLRVGMQKGFGEVNGSLDRIATMVKSLETAIETRMKIHELEYHK
jgi:hypothetical protein